MNVRPISAAQSLVIAQRDAMLAFIQEKEAFFETAEFAKCSEKDKEDFKKLVVLKHHQLDELNQRIAEF